MDSFTIAMIEERTWISNPVERPLEKLLIALSEVPCDILIAPEYYFMHKGSPYSAIQRQETIHAILEASAGQKTLIVPGSFFWEDGKNSHNTTTVISDGKILCEYAKRNDADDSKIGKYFGYEWMPGNASNQFRWKDIEASVQICCDFSDEPLRSPVDLQIVIAHSLIFNEYNLNLTQGGLFVRSDGGKMLFEAGRKLSDSDKIEGYQRVSGGYGIYLVQKVKRGMTKLKVAQTYLG